MGKALPTIKLDGTDHITIDTSVNTVTIGGEIANGVFTSAKPGGKPNPIPMLIGFANTTLNVPINAVHVTFTVDAIAGKLTGGKIGGAILDTDVQKVLLPGIGAQLTAEVAAGAQDSATIEQMFDNGGVAATGVQQRPAKSRRPGCALRQTISASMVARLTAISVPECFASAGREHHQQLGADCSRPHAQDQGRGVVGTHVRSGDGDVLAAGRGYAKAMGSG